MRGSVAALFGLGLVPIATTRAAEAVQPVTLTTTDGVRVYGRYLAAGSPTAPIVLLFHQAGSSKDEYAPIAPRLADEGYASLAIDQRSGGGLFGPNETVGTFGRPAGYDDALADLEAALLWARTEQPDRPVVLWGSSYSASLVFLLAAEHPDEVAAVLAFSPGEYLSRAGAVGRAASQVRMPVFVTSAQSAGEEQAAAEILAAVPAAHKVQFRPTRGGTHGASTLRPDTNARGAADVWDAVLAFLHGSAPSPGR